MSINNFIQKNLWNLMILIASLLIAFVMVRGQIAANAQDIVEIKNRVETIEQLVERVIILEEHDREISADLQEIKQEVKDTNNKTQQILIRLGE